jgi:hypothetical protein
MACSRRLLAVACAYGLATVGGTAQSRAEPLGAPDDEQCARCFAENRQLTGRMEQLLARLDQLEAELVAHRANRRGGYVMLNCGCRLLYACMRVCVCVCVCVRACVRARPCVRAK